MAISEGPGHIGPGHGQMMLKTSREGVASQAGHDLTIEVTRWSADLTAGPDGAPTALSARIDMGSLIVRDGTGGLKPLTDRDKREIAVTARKTLQADRHPEATFSADGFQPAAGGGGVISGTLTLAGQSRPLRLQVTQAGQDRYHATASVLQSQFGIKPYRGFFGALKVSDAVELVIDVDLARAPGAAI